MGGGQRLEPLSKEEKRAHGHGQQCGDSWGQEGIKELNANGKNIIKIKLKKKKPGKMTTFSQHNEGIYQKKK